MHKYEATVVLWTDRELTDDEQRLFGDALEGTDVSLARALTDSGLDCGLQVEVHGPLKVVPA